VGWMSEESWLNSQKEKEFLCSPTCPDGLWGPPSLQLSGHWELFSQDSGFEDMKLTTDLLLEPR